MKECAFCRDPLKDNEIFTIKSPQGNDLCMCAECMEDFLTFFKSGKAEEKKLSVEKPHLMIKPYRMGYGFIGLLDGDERKYENIQINNISTKQMQIFIHHGGGISAALPISNDYLKRSPSERRGYEFSIDGIAFVDREPFFDDGVPF